jgi:hypothetical protein
MAGPNLASAASGGTGPQAFDLTSLANLKAYIFASSPNAPSASDALLQRMLSSASQMIQDYLGYDVGRGQMLAATSYTETRDSIDDGMGWPSNWVYAIPVRWSPLVSVSAVSIDGVTIPSGGDAVKNPGYFIDAQDAVQIYVSGYRPIPRGRKNVIVSYVGGYSAIPYDIEQACIETVALRYKELDRIGLRSQAMAGETTSYNLVAMPDSVKMAINAYRRVVI